MYRKSKGIIMEQEDILLVSIYEPNFKELIKKIHLGLGRKLITFPRGLIYMESSSDDDSAQVKKFVECNNCLKITVEYFALLDTRRNQYLC